MGWCRISFPDCQVEGALMKYTQLTQEQRYQLHALLKMEHNRTEIADTLGVHKSTISRELQRNRGKRGYRPKSYF